MTKKLLILFLNYKSNIIYIMLFLIMIFNLMISCKVISSINNPKYSDEKYKTLFIYENVDCFNENYDGNSSVQIRRVIFDSWKDLIDYYNSNNEEFMMIFYDNGTQQELINQSRLLGDLLYLKKVMKIVSIILVFLFICIIESVNKNKYVLLFLLGYNNMQILKLRMICSLPLFLFFVINLIL